MTPTQRSLKLLRERGYFVAIVEHWNHYARIRQDLFGFADLMALSRDTVLLVQTTSASNVSARIRKIKSSQAAALWLESPNRLIHVHGWAKRARHWVCREVPITEVP